MLFNRLETDLAQLRVANDVLAQASFLKSMSVEVQTARNSVNEIKRSRFTAFMKGAFASASLDLWEQALGDVMTTGLKQLYGGGQFALIGDMNELTDIVLNSNRDVPRWVETVAAVDRSQEQSWDFAERALRSVHSEIVNTRHQVHATHEEKKQVGNRLLFVLMQMAAIMSYKCYNWEIKILGDPVPGTSAVLWRRPPIDTPPSRVLAMHRAKDLVRRPFVWWFERERQMNEEMDELSRRWTAEFERLTAENQGRR